VAYRRLIDRAAVLGSTWLLDLGAGQKDHLEPYVTLMRRMAPYAHQAGIQITVKPHGGITRTTGDLISVYERVDHPAFALCYDPGNIIYYTQGDERPETAIDRVAPMVMTGIIKDCIVRDGRPDVMITPGEGWVDFDAVLGGLVNGAFRGPLYVECVGGTTVDEIDLNLRKTRAFVESILARLPS
jgi:sugar phosphate isomerase/epimerase